MSYHRAHQTGAHHYLSGGASNPRLVAWELGANSALGSYSTPRLVARELGALSGGELTVLQTVKAAQKNESAEKKAQRKKKVQDAGRSQYEAAKNTPTDFEVLKSKKLKNGETIRQSSVWSDWNKTAAKVTKNFDGVFKHLPYPGPLLSTRPLDALMDIFDPIEIQIGSAIDRVIASKGATQNFFGTLINCKRVQSNDWKCDASTQNLLKRLRTMQAWFVLWWTQPAAMTWELGVQGINLAGMALNAIAETAEKAAKAVGKVASDAKKFAEDRAADVAEAFGLGSYGANMSGLGVTGADDAAAAAAAAAPADAASLATQSAPIIVPILAKLIPEVLKFGMQAVEGVVSSVLPKSPKASKQADDTEPKESGIPPVVLVGGVAVAALLLLRR